MKILKGHRCDLILDMLDPSIEKTLNYIVKLAVWWCKWCSWILHLFIGSLHARQSPSKRWRGGRKAPEDTASALY